VKLWGLRKPQRPSTDAWWAAANAAAGSLTPDRLTDLRASATSTSDPDEAERIEEMLDGLERLLELADDAPLPTLDTQHRVIGEDLCHFSAPASLRQETDVPGRVFVTSRRLLFAGTRVHAWPWHRVTRLVRTERVVTVAVAGAEPPMLVCNSYGDALVLVRLAARLRG
jgi:hypothetical protein